MWAEKNKRKKARENDFWMSECSFTPAIFDRTFVCHSKRT
jgi:hypothetical protein